MAEKVLGWGSRLRQARRDLGLSQLALAERIGKTRPTIASWEDEETSPGVLEIPALAKALRVTPSWLVFGRECAA